jgi:hypothetical protein
VTNEEVEKMKQRAQRFGLVNNEVEDEKKKQRE